MGACAAAVAAAWSTVGCAPQPQAPAVPADVARSATHFEVWRRDGAGSLAGDLAAFEASLADTGLAGVVPLHELLRSASAWRECGGAPYAVPPRPQWPAVHRVLALVAELRRQRLLDSIEVHSGYRDAALNACAGGARRSAHLVAFALDFTVPAGADPTAGLCAFWRREGAAWSMGLSRYPSGRIHVDTLGWRTWGADGTSATSACTLSP